MELTSAVESANPAFVELRLNPGHYFRKQIKMLSTSRTPNQPRSEATVDTSSRKKDSSNDTPYCLLGTSIKTQRHTITRDPLVTEPSHQ